jgi:AdoMet-dependent heme synthase
MFHPGHNPEPFLPRVLAWELTRRCNLNCIHCRATASEHAPEGELTLSDYQALIDNVAAFASPIIILSGGEPLMRPDLYDIAAHATARGLRVAVSTNGTLVTPEVARRLLAAGVATCSISIDGSNPDVHDDFRQQPGAFDASLRGMTILQEAGIKAQVNTSLTRRNMDDLDNIYHLVKRMKAHAWHIFMLVPTGRGTEAADRDLIGADDYERILNYVYEKNRDEQQQCHRFSTGDNFDSCLEIKPTCAPQYYRIMRQRAKADGIPVDVEHFGLNARTRGCLAGLAFGFVSYRGDVFPCGYYPKSAGNVHEKSFREIWEHSELFLQLRDFKNLKGACGSCGYVRVCGGCRARALALTGDDLAAEPYCRHGLDLEAAP